MQPGQLAITLTPGSPRPAQSQVWTATCESLAGCGKKQPRRAHGWVMAADLHIDGHLSSPETIQCSRQWVGHLVPADAKR